MLLKQKKFKEKTTKKLYGYRQEDRALLPHHKKSLARN